MIGINGRESFLYRSSDRTSDVGSSHTCGSRVERQVWLLSTTKIISGRPQGPQGTMIVVSITRGFSLCITAVDRRLKPLIITRLAWSGWQLAE
jgi:hypothetical protein